jgi:hypothetical protein
MRVSVQNAETLSLEQIRRFLRAGIEVAFRGLARQEVYRWVEKLLRQQQYPKQPKQARGLLLQYLVKMTGRSVAQIVRLIRRYRQTGEVREIPHRRHRFRTTYTKTDIGLLASVDEAHQRMSGPATQQILRREWEVFGKPEFQRLAGISVSHLYNLRRTITYRRRSTHCEKTRPATVALGERRRPDPRGRPGYLRADTVHQPEREGQKSVYHINVVDEVTQWEVLGCVPKITEHYLIPVLEGILAQFPFRIRGFHCDNGSEYVNEPVVKLLNKLLAEFTRSRARHTNDNALVEGKNGAVVRKHMHYSWLPPSHAADIDGFYRQWLNVYLNFHRPCAYARVTTDAKGKQRKVYDTYATPYERLKSLPQAKRYLRPGLSFAGLDQMAAGASDTDFARQMQQAKQALFERCARTGAGAPTLRDPSGPTPPGLGEPRRHGAVVGQKRGRP